MRIVIMTKIALLTGLTTAFVGCGGGGGGSDAPRNGMLSIAITDAPSELVTEVNVQFTGISVKPESGEVMDFTFAGPLDIDLLALNGGNSATLLDNQIVPAGRYNWIRLHVNAAFDLTLDSYVVETSGLTSELAVPSGSQAGLRLVSGFTVTANQNSSFVIDWDLMKALTNPPGQPGWFLRPALRITDMTEYGSISGTVADTLLMDPSCNNDLAAETGSSVYIYDGHDVTPEDIGGTGVQPLATASVKMDPNTAGAYTYSATFLSPGTYTVALTCQGLSEDPDADDALVFVQPTNATVADDTDTIIDFQ